MRPLSVHAALPLLLAAATLVGCASRAAGTNVAPAVPPMARSAPGDIDVQPLLAPPAALATAAGAGPLVVVARGPVAEHGRLGAFVDVPDGLCLLAFARSAPSVEDLDLSVFADDGTPLASDDGPDAHPTVLFCPSRGGRVYVVAVVASGGGWTGIGVELAPPSVANSVRTALDAHGPRSDAAHAADDWPGLEDRVRRRLGARVGRWEVFRKVAFVVDSRVPTTLAFPVEAGGCTDAVVVPDDDVGGLDVEVTDEAGRGVARASASERDRVLTVCSPYPLAGSLVVRPRVGQGLAAVALSRGSAEAARDGSPALDLAWSAATETVETARARLERTLASSGYGHATGSQALALSLGASRSFVATLPGADGASVGCFRFDVVGGAPTGLVAASAWSDAGVLVASGEGASATTLFACGTRTVRVDVEARGRPGPAFVAWRPERSSSSSGPHPLAMARMLTRMVGLDGALPGEARPTRAFALAADHESVVASQVPAGSCVRFAFGADGPGSGLTGRVIDAASGEEIDRSAGVHALALGACAGDAPRSVHVSLSLVAGSLDVVMGERATSSAPR